MTTLLPACPLCDQPIGYNEEHTLYVEDDYKCLAHMECVVELGDDDEFEDEDGIEFVSFPDEDDDEEEEWD